MAKISSREFAVKRCKDERDHQLETKPAKKAEKVLVTGCAGQIGKALIPALCAKYGA